MPGFTPRLPLEYRAQVVMPPLKSWINRNADDSDLLFDDPRPFLSHTDTDATSFSSEHMHELQRQSQRLVDMRSYAYHLKKDQANAKQAHDQHNNDNPLMTQPSLVEYDLATNNFISIINSSSK